jgi:plastocyanin
MTARRFGLILITVLLWSTGCGSGGASTKDGGGRSDADAADAGGAMEVAADRAADDAEVAAVDAAEVGDADAGGTGSVDGSGDAGLDGSLDGSGDGDSGVDAPEVSRFTMVPPCNTEFDYGSGTTVSFMMNDAMYSPKCITIRRGGSVTFAAIGGGFENHPLRASRKRGDRAMNPITNTDTGTMVTFAFPDPGYFAYFCAFHGFSDTGTGSMMDGVVWVQ